MAAMTTHEASIDAPIDDLVTVFQLDGQPVRGRAVRMGAALDKAIGERYPEPVARLLGEAMMIGALVARSLKFDGRLIIQCFGKNEGAVSLLIAVVRQTELYAAMRAGTKPSLKKLCSIAKTLAQIFYWAKAHFQ